MTYVPTKEGWLYVAGVLDECSWRLLGLAMAARLDATLPHAALCQAPQSWRDNGHRALAASTRNSNSGNLLCAL
jgi:transposase InsO family protein